MKTAQKPLTINHAPFTKQKKTFGFTLVELLVTMTIIALLSAIGLTTFSSVQKSARDARRKDDLKHIKIALELYYQKNGSYPLTSLVDDWLVYSNAAQPWIPGLDSSYISKVPTDPLQSTAKKKPQYDNEYGYAYIVNVVAFDPDGAAGPMPTYEIGQCFGLITQLENKADNQRNELQNYKVCGISTLTGQTPPWSNYSYIINSED